MAKVTVIPSRINPLTKAPNNIVVKRKVAAYARVSTDSDEQLTSYEAQKDYYTKYIENHADWEFVKVYADEGISGTNTKNRTSFNEMIADALAGKIDLIITKSVSRFARNTVDSLTTIRKLKEHGVECFFEKENIYTFDSKGELLITIMSSLAQEESRSISQNVTWGKRKAFSDGKVSMAYKNFLGYKKGANGKPEIVPEEAEIIVRIYKLFMEGNSIYHISEILNEDKVPTPSKGAKTKWQATTVKSILTNEKYKGDALLQKTYICDFLTHTSKKNEGEIDQYYVKGNHPYIIKPEEWDLVQAELERRKELGASFSSNSVFACRLVCGDCGAFYGAKTWHSNDQWKKVIWQCNHKYKNKERCKTKSLNESTIKDAFVRAFNALSKEKGDIINRSEEIIKLLDNTSLLNKEINEKEAELDVIAGLVDKLIKDNASGSEDLNEFQSKYDEYSTRYEKLNKELADLKAELDRKQKQKMQIRLFIEQYKKQPEVLSEFDETIWQQIIDKAVVYESSIKFIFVSGVEKEVEI